MVFPGHNTLQLFVGVSFPSTQQGVSGCLYCQPATGISSLLSALGLIISRMLYLTRTSPALTVWCCLCQHNMLSWQICTIAHWWICPKPINLTSLLTGWKCPDQDQTPKSELKSTKRSPERAKIIQLNNGWLDISTEPSLEFNGQPSSCPSEEHEDAMPKAVYPSCHLNAPCVSCWPGSR